jgi:hypothetical protein
MAESHCESHSASEMRPDRNPRPASISAGGLGILPMGSLGIATIGALPESMRRSHGKRSATRRKNRIRLNRWSSSGAGVSCGSRPVSDADACARCKQARDLRRSRLDLPTKKPRFRPATTMADAAPRLSKSWLPSATSALATDLRHRVDGQSSLLVGHRSSAERLWVEAH